MKARAPITIPSALFYLVLALQAQAQTPPCPPGQVLPTGIPPDFPNAASYCYNPCGGDWVWNDGTDGRYEGCHPPATTTPVCAGNQVLNAAGDTCIDPPVCLNGQVLNADRNQCVNPPSPPPPPINWVELINNGNNLPPLVNNFEGQYTPDIANHPVRSITWT